MKRNIYLSLLLCIIAIAICGNANAASTPEPTPQINKWVKTLPKKQKTTPAKKANKTKTQKKASKPEVITIQDSDTTKAIGSTVVSEEEIMTEIKIVSDTKEVMMNADDRNSSQSPTQPTVERDKIFTTVEQHPMFPGGDAALMKYLAEHLRYPEDAQQNNIQGRVVVRFVIDKTGNVGQVQVMRGKHPSLDREAVRVIKSLPKFIPGKNNGQPVNCYFTLPVTFKLQN